jgi:hypothetical protein
LIRSDCLGTIAALRKGSFGSPALQNIALLHNRLFMDVGAAPPLYLHVLGVVMKAEGVDDLPRSAARARRASESMAALQRNVTSEAEERLEEPSPWISSRLQTTRSSRGSSSCTLSRSPRVPMPSLSWIGASLAARTAASSTASVHLRSRREAAGAVRGQGALRRPTRCHRGPICAVGPGVANTRGRVSHVSRRSAGPVRHRA